MRDSNFPDSDFHDSYWRDDSNANNPEASSDAALESLIRAAGDYVHPTGDLRPRTLEAARLRCRQQRRASGMAFAAILLVLMLPSGMQRPAHFNRINPFSETANVGSLRWQAGQWQADRSKVTSAGQVTDGNVNWALVEGFTQLRRHQAELLHGARATR